MRHSRKIEIEKEPKIINEIKGTEEKWKMKTNTFWWLIVSGCFWSYFGVYHPTLMKIHDLVINYH